MCCKCNLLGEQKANVLNEVRKERVLSKANVTHRMTVNKAYGREIITLFSQSFSAPFFYLIFLFPQYVFLLVLSVVRFSFAQFSLSLCLSFSIPSLPRRFPSSHCSFSLLRFLCHRHVRQNTALVSSRRAAKVATLTLSAQQWDAAAGRCP